MLLYLVRHGKTDYNDEGLVQGHLDVPLNIQGRRQAERLAEHLRMVPVKEVWTSDLVRAEETAKAIVALQPRASLRIDPRLRERNYGELEGKKWLDKGNIEYTPESEAELFQRLHLWLSSLIQTNTPLTSPLSTPRTPISPADPGAGTIIAVTHQVCLRALLRILLGAEGDKALADLEPRSPVEVHVPPGVDTALPSGNTAVAIVRVWWEDAMDSEKMGELVARGRLEAWGLDDHLDVDEREGAAAVTGADYFAGAHLELD